MAARHETMTVGGAAAVRLTNGITATTPVMLQNQGPGNIMIAPSANTTAPPYPSPTACWTVLTPSPGGFVAITVAGLWGGFANATEIHAIAPDAVGRTVAISHG